MATRSFLQLWGEAPRMFVPDTPFFLFGMGGRRKLLCRGGALLDVPEGGAVERWEVESQHIVPGDYAVHLKARDGRSLSIIEDEEAVWIEQAGEREALTRGQVSLPTFQGHRYGPVLRVLHQEMLVNIVNGAPVPNLFVYDTPWYRDAAMVCMCLEKTGNLHLVRDWILGLREPFDRNNAQAASCLLADGRASREQEAVSGSRERSCGHAGACEPDNLGQVLYLISLVSDASHLLIPRVLEEAERFRQGSHILGITDGREHPVYQTKWMKYGLRALGLDDPYEIPAVYDSYSALFWMDYREEHVKGPRFSPRSRQRYPYLGWAEDHFYGEPPGPVGAGPEYPLTWEAHASEARYDGMAVVSEEYVRRRTAAPHTWHAAEMFLHLLAAGG